MYAHSDEGALLLMFEDGEEAFESFFLCDVVGSEDDFVLRRTDLAKRIMNFAPPPPPPLALIPSFEYKNAGDGKGGAEKEANEEGRALGEDFVDEASEDSLVRDFLKLLLLLSELFDRLGTTPVPVFFEKEERLCLLLNPCFPPSAGTSQPLSQPRVEGRCAGAREKKLRRSGLKTSSSVEKSCIPLLLVRPIRCR